MLVCVGGGRWKVEGGGWRMEDGGWRMEDGGWRMGDGGWRMEDGGGVGGRGRDGDVVVFGVDRLSLGSSKMLGKESRYK